MEVTEICTARPRPPDHIPRFEPDLLAGSHLDREVTSLALSSVDERLNRGREGREVRVERHKATLML